MHADPLVSALLVVLLAFNLLAQPLPHYRVAREQVPNGAELLTIIRHEDHAQDIPLISVLRDTLGDENPENDRLRYVWILTGAPTSPLQNIVSALPFAHFRPRSKEHIKSVPKPFLDLGSPSASVWGHLLDEALQMGSLDPLGGLLRAPIRSYSGNREDYRKLQAFRAISIIEGLLRDPESQQLLRQNDLEQLYARLSLSNRLLGGLVRDESLGRYYERQTDLSELTREHNWELLRQRAELFGLYFEPIPAPDGTFREALLSIARKDLGDHPQQRFDAQFLTISNPWTDDRLKSWGGYSQTRYLDEDNRLVTAEAPGARPIELIPLALYSLEYPRVPLLLVDFRHSMSPKLREIAAQDANIFLNGVLGVTRFSNWPVWAATTILSFVRKRHGATVLRDSRLRVQSQAYEHISMNTTLDPVLKDELLQRLENLRISPFENTTAKESIVAREQYSALRQYAASSNGLNVKLNNDRYKEEEGYDDHRSSSRVLRDVQRSFVSAPRAAEDPNVLAELDLHRRAAQHMRFLNMLLAAGPFPEVNGDADEIRESIDALADEPDAEPRATHVIAQFLKRTQDPELRMVCFHALESFNREQTRKELELLIRDPHTTEIVRTLCQTYLNRPVEQIAQDATE